MSPSFKLLPQGSQCKSENAEMLAALLPKLHQNMITVLTYQWWMNKQSKNEGTQSTSFEHESI